MSRLSFAALGSGHRVSDLLHDIRYATRTFRREPAFVTGVVLTFGLVIGANAAMLGLVRRLMLAPPPGIQTLIDPQLRSWRLGATLFSAFGLLALGIAAVGLFAVVSYLVAQRTPEIGVRLALGGRVGGLVIRDALRMTVAGGVAGLLAALAAAPLVEPMRFQTSARDPAVLLVAVAAMVVVTVGAAAVPAVRAGRVSPMTVLRDAD